MATQCFLKPFLNSAVGSSGYFYSNPTRSVLALATSITNTTASGTKIQATATGGGTAIKWISPQVATPFTLSGTVTFNVWAKEAATGNNATLRVELVKFSGGSEGSVFAAATFGSELTTTMAVKNWTVSPTLTAFATGDRIVAYLYVVNVGTMGAGSPGVTVDYAGPTNAADGDSYFQLNENITFYADPEYIQKKTGTVSSATSLAQTLPGVSATGNTFVVQGQIDSQAQTVTIADTKGNTWAAASGPNNWNGSTSRDYFWTAPITTGGGAADQITITRSGAAGFIALAVYEYAGIASSPLDVVGAAATGNSANPASNNATTTKRDLLVGLGDWGGSAPTQTPQGAFVSRDTFFATEDLVAVAGLNNAGMTFAPSQQWVYVMLALFASVQDKNVSLTGVSGTGSVGTATVQGAANVNATGVSGTGAVTAPTITAAANVNTTGVSGTGAVGSPTVSANATVSPTGVGGSGVLGNVSLTADALVALLGLQGTAAVGTVTIDIMGDVTVFVTGVQGTGQLGAVAVQADANVSVIGNQGTGEIGAVTVVTNNANVTVNVTGVSATGQVGTVYVVPPTGLGAAYTSITQMMDIISNPRELFSKRLATAIWLLMYLKPRYIVWRNSVFSQTIPYRYRRYPSYVLIDAKIAENLPDFQYFIRQAQAILDDPLDYNEL